MTAFNILQTDCQKVALKSTRIIMQCTFSPSSPLDMGLLMADCKLTLADIYLGLHIRPGMLIILAACESGLIDLKFANEYQGLPIGFFSEAAGAVISSLWRVNDCSTMLIMQTFYKALIAGHSAAHALKSAQEYAKTITAGELAQLFNKKNRNISLQIPKFNHSSSMPGGNFN